MIRVGRCLPPLLAAAVIAVAAAAYAAGAVAQPSTPRPTPTTEPRAFGDDGLGASATGYANLVVQGIEVVPSNGILVDRSVIIRVTVANIGNTYPTNGVNLASFYLDVFIDPAVSTAEDLLSMPGYASDLSQGMQAAWLPAGATYTVQFNYAFETSGIHDVFAVVDIAELGLPYGNVNEGGGAGESDNAYGPLAIEVLEPNVITAKNAGDYVRGPASSLALVPVATPTGDGGGTGLLTFGDTSLTLGYFEEPPFRWGYEDPATPDYNMSGLDSRLNDDSTSRPQQWARLAAIGDLGTDSQGAYIDDDDVCHASTVSLPLLVTVWEDRRNSALTDWDVYLTYSTDQGDSFAANLKVNDDGSGNDQRHPAVAISPCNGRTLVVWQDNRQGQYDIWAQWYQFSSATGQLIAEGGNFLVASAAGIDSLTPDVAAGPGSERDPATQKLLYYNFYVVWQSNAAGNSDVYLRGWSPPSGWSATARRISDDTESANQRAPRVAAGRTEVLVDWTTVGCTDGVPVFSLATEVVNPIVVTWEDDRSGDFDIYATFSIDEFQTFAMDTRINDDTEGNGISQRTPVVGVVQAWQVQELTDDDGVCPSLPGEVATATVNTPSAGFYFAWQDYRNSTDSAMTNDPDIYSGYISFDLTGGSLDEDLTLDANEDTSQDGAGAYLQESPALATRSYTYIDPDSGLETYFGHSAFIVWADRRNPGHGCSDIYMAVRGDAEKETTAMWTGNVIQVNSGAHAENLAGSTYLDYEVGDPPGAFQVRPSVAADLWAGPATDENDLHWHRGFVFVGWDDNRRGGYDRDVYMARSNMTYFANYDFYGIDPLQVAVAPPGQYCKFGAGSYVSPIYDVGVDDVIWDRIEWNAATASSTFVTLQTRVGSDPENMGEWLPKTFPFGTVGLENLGAPLQGYGEPGEYIVDAEGRIHPSGRYIQYRVNLWTWPLYGPTSGWCGSLADEPQIVWDYPVARTPIVYSVTLHYTGGLRTALLPMVMRRYSR